MLLWHFAGKIAGKINGKLRSDIPPWERFISRGNAPADGYTLLMVGPSSAVNATLYAKLKFAFLRDIAPVASVTVQMSAPSSSID